MTGGTLGASAGIGICFAIGIATAGAGGVACAAVGSLVAGTAASSASDYLMDLWLK